VLTVGVVTKPFQFEGAKRMRQAEEGVEALQKMVDTLIIIPNQNLFRLANEKTTFTEAFSLADDVLYQGVKGVTDLMVRPGLINLDFADVRAVMDEMGKAMMGTGEDSGEDRAIQAAEKAIANPLLDEISLRGAKGVLINITGGHDLTLFELDEAANRIREEVDADANIIVGSTMDPSMEGSMRVSVVATGIDASEDAKEIPVPRRKLSEPLKPVQVAAEEAPARVAEEAEPLKPVQVAAEEAPARVAEEVQRPTEVAARYETEYEPEADEEPSLFNSFDAERAAAEEQMEDIFEGDSRTAASDDLPPPVYTPRHEQAAFMDAADDTESFVAPKAPSAGSPSPDALARLHNAVQNTPRAQQQVRPVAPEQSAESSGERSRFGINSLINRMTGQGDAQEQSPRPARQQPTMQARSEQQEAREEEEDQIEIPAFLRRQAN